MHHRAKDITGSTHGCLTVTGYYGSNGKKSLWTVQCECGNVKTMTGGDFLENQSCGCLKKLSTCSAICQHSTLYITKQRRVSVALGVFPQKRAVHTPLVNFCHPSRETLPGKA